MDAETIFRLMKPHLDHMDTSEKNILSNLITAVPPQKISCNHKKVLSLKKAKENLEAVCRQKMQLEKAKAGLQHKK